MPHVCRNCKRTFDSAVELDLHRDTCSEGQLFCDRCGERFSEAAATEDGWHYRCPTEDCDGEEIGEDLHEVEKARIRST